MQIHSFSVPRPNQKLQRNIGVGHFCDKPMVVGKFQRVPVIDLDMSVL